MHTFSDTGAGVPAFLAKLWRLVEDPETNNLICWSKDGRSFIIQNQAQFARELLPLNYKHNNMASFIRQLNMYGFHKITSIDNGGLKFDRDDMEFSHPCFKRNCPYLLEHIKRKIANTKSIDEKATVKSEAVSKVLSDVKAMRGRQDSLDSRFSVMKQENEALWREIASLRQKHAKQQQIVNKLIQFLITIVQPSRNNMTSVKRHMQLMINDTPEQAKLRKPSESGSECGPVIHELGEELFDEANNVDDDSDLDAPMSPYVNLPSVGSSNMDNENDSPVPKTERPQSNGSIHSQLFDYSNQSVDDARSAAGNITPGHSGAVINAVNADGSQIVYHVTELADSAPQTPEAVINEENHLTTPMVKEMNRNQMPQIKPKSNKRKIGNVSSTVTTSSSSSPATKMLRSSGNGTSPLLIKTEKNDVDPMAFWNNANFSPSGGVVENISATGNDALASPSSSTLNMNTTLDPRLISPLNDQATKITSDAVDMYNADNFIASDMPSQLFEGESPIIDDANILGGGSYNSKFDFRPSASSSGRSSQQKSTQSVGKFADFGNEELSSTSKNNNSKLQLSKVNNGNNLNPNDLREEVTMHIDTVQDDLETLKDLLRTDSYALDANTLMGNGTPPGGRIYIPPQLEADFFTKLFNDSDILGPYGLGMAPDQQDKKGSELMTYQPIYDLSDIIDINKDNEDTSTNGSNAKPMSPASSVLNTPYHE